jgi:serine/threonine-protein kinase ATR
MTNELLALCDHPVDENKSTLSMSKDFPRLNRLGCSELIIPLQESLTVTLPPPSSVESNHQPFPLNTPTFKGFLIRIIVNNSQVILTTFKQNFMMKLKL